jgi:oligopeptide/dipeptide ABC transporter ATP-binding protein
MTLLTVNDLSTEFRTDEGTVRAVDGISLEVNEGETLGIVGESGSGKSVTAMSIMNLIDAPGEITGGEILFKGTDLLNADEETLQNVRGSEIGMIFQDPSDALNPVYTVGEQISETLRAHEVCDEEIGRIERSFLELVVPRRNSKKRNPRSWERAVELLEATGIPDPRERAEEYPHQYSGGMKQRAVIAQAIACEPDLIIADEPTTALDVTIESQILGLLEDLQEDIGMGMILITHDLAVISEVCDRIAVMYAGQIVETGTKEQIFSNPRHPYTQSLIRSIPDVDTTQELEPTGGQVPDLVDMPDACYFAPRCEYAHDDCYAGVPDMYFDSDDVDRETAHEVRCVLYNPENPNSPPDIDDIQTKLSGDAAPDERASADGGSR